MKKLLLLAAAAAGAVLVQKKLKDQQAEKDLWAAATETSAGTSATGDAWSAETDKPQG